MNVNNHRLLDVKTSFVAIPKKGRDVKFSGSIMADDDVHTHVQGVAAYKDFQLLTHSDRARKSWRILIADRRPNQLKLVEEFSLPIVSSTPPFYLAREFGRYMVTLNMAPPIVTAADDTQIEQQARSVQTRT